MRREWIRFAAALAFVVGGALLPASASRAGLGTFFGADACPTFSEVTDAYDFADSFVGIAKCESLCKQAASSCKKAVKAAGACQLAFASDWVAFDSAVDCAGLTGGDKKDCKAGWAADLKSWRNQIKGSRDGFSGLRACDGFLSDPSTGCLHACSGI